MARARNALTSWRGCCAARAPRTSRASSADDPLRLQELGARRARERWYLLDAERVFERAAAHVAYAGAQAKTEELDKAWLVRQVEQVLERLIDEEREEELRAPLDCDPEDPRYVFFRSLWIEPRYARAASLAFWLMLEQRTVADVLSLGSWTEEELMRDCWRVLGALGIHDLASPPDPNWQLKP